MNLPETMIHPGRQPHPQTMKNHCGGFMFLKTKTVGLSYEPK